MAGAFDDLSDADKHQARKVRNRLLPVKPLTVQDIAAGKTHKQYDIDHAYDELVPIPLRNRRSTAYIVGCYCTLCEARRTQYLTP